MPNRSRRSLALFALVHTTLLATAAHADPTPTIDKMGMVFHLVPHFHKAEWTWTPSLKFRVAGPISSAATLAIEYTQPGGKAWTKVQCDSGETAANEWLTLNDCGFRQEDSVATNQTGQFGFKITLSDPLAGKTATLFAGKFTVGKQLYNPTKTAAGNKQFYYYVDQDWRLPLGYVGTKVGDISNNLYADLWIKNEIPDTGKIRGYLFYGGKQVSETWASYPLQATPPETKNWEYHLIQLKFPALTEKPVSDGIDGWKLWENPGEYEIKLLREGKIARTLKFTVKGGKPVDAGAAVANGLAKDGALVPVTVLDSGDGSWRKDAWKTEAFFGNPVTGL